MPALNYSIIDLETVDKSIFESQRPCPMPAVIGSTPCDPVNGYFNHIAVKISGQHLTRDLLVKAANCAPNFTKMLSVPNCQAHFIQHTHTFMNYHSGLMSSFSPRAVYAKN